MLTSTLVVWALGIPAGVLTLTGLIGRRRGRSLARLSAPGQAYRPIPLLGAIRAPAGGRRTERFSAES